MRGIGVGGMCQAIDYTTDMAAVSCIGWERQMPARLMNRIAETDSTFVRQGGDWVGRCLICRGPLRFDTRTGEGASVEHIVPRCLGGASELHNLGITHVSCNGEKGRHWDSHRRRADHERYSVLVKRLQREREARWHAAPGKEAAYR
jgi:5-methylcytosine-specific restriction endonuclease McrA